MLKYKDLTELAAGFAKGELEGYELMVDNDQTMLRYNGPMDEEGNLPDGRFIDEVTDECHEWYQGKGYADILEAIRALGIPANWC